MTQIYRLEDKNSDRRVGGLLFKFPSGTTKTMRWETGAPIEPTLEAAKKYAAEVIDKLMRTDKWDDINRTNWTSATAAIQKHIKDFNARLRAKLHADPLLIGSQQIFDASTVVGGAQAVDPHRALLENSRLGGSEDRRGDGRVGAGGTGG